MTRINAGIPPAELTKAHLIAEHREIKRIPNCIKKGRYSLNGQPKEFKLGPGHVKFFYDKLKYLHKRYNEIYEYGLSKNINFTNYNSAFEDLPPELYNDWEPTEEARQLIRERIRERLEGK